MIHQVHLLSLDLTLLSDIQADSLSMEEKESLALIQNPKRKRELLGSLFLKNHLYPTNILLHKDSGVPYLKNNPDTKISISHSSHQLIMAFAPYNIGVDIEKISSKVCRVASKFANSKEEQLFDVTSEEEMTRLWTMKEALYKLAEGRQTDYKNKITVYREDTTYYGEIFLSDGEWHRTEIYTFVENDCIISFNLSPLV